MYLVLATSANKRAVRTQVNRSVPWNWTSPRSGRKNLAVGETHGTVREHAIKPRGGDIGFCARSMSPLRGLGRSGICYPGARAGAAKCCCRCAAKTSEPARRCASVVIGPDNVNAPSLRFGLVFLHRVARGAHCARGNRRRTLSDHAATTLQGRDRGDIHTQGALRRVRLRSPWADRTGLSGRKTGRPPSWYSSSNASAARPSLRHCARFPSAFSQRD